jgi:cob(I)alamin adenosyltransferase
MTPESDQTEEARHTAKMAKIKAARDKIMATKQGEKGLIIVHTGAGKGKSSSGFGMVLRCIAHGMPCGVVQFIKGAWDTGERRLIEGHFADLCQFYAMGEGFTWETQDRARDVAAAGAAWAEAKRMMADPSIRLLVLDELNIALRYDYLPLAEIVAALAARRPGLHVVVTGRNAKPEMIEAADCVTEFTLVKHHFAAGVRAQEAIEF